MNPMETMAVNILSKVTGMSAEQMQGMANSAMNLLKSLDSRLTALEAASKEIQSVMEEVKSVFDALGIHGVDKDINDAESVMQEVDKTIQVIGGVTNVELNNG